jgi:hypothetical protein
LSSFEFGTELEKLGAGQRRQFLLLAAARVHRMLKAVSEQKGISYQCTRHLLINLTSRVKELEILLFRICPRELMFYL